MTEYNFLDYCQCNSHYNPEEKNFNIMLENLYKIDEMSQFITYEGLPETIPQRVLEKFLMLNGSALFTQHDGNFYIMLGGKGGYLDYNFEPTQYIFSNPYLRFTGIANIKNEPETMGYKQYSNGDGILIRNDSLSIGCLPVIDKYNTLVAELDLTIRNAITLMRVGSLATASSMKTKNAVDKWLEAVIDGKMQSVLDSSFFDGDSGSVKLQPLLNNSSGNYLTSLIEMRQYLTSTLNNKLGVNCNFNMKREALSTAECSLNDQSVVPLILDMFNCRLEAVEKINKKYSLNIRVKLNNLWASNVENTENSETEVSTDSESTEKSEQLDE